ncbi:hypothetical protein PG999_013705 [Apiospora kogelbergensis]|uniref:Uncharacterized protein n=1 Tax=Apiospora kogelbergensis TaxID=1337665 RepID=A0AAW0Q6W7_9PEZI
MNAPHAQDADGTFSLPLTMSKRGRRDGIETAVLNRTRLAKTDEEDLFLYSTPLYFTGFFPGYSKNATGGDGHAYTWIVLKFRQEDQSGTVMLRSGNPFDVPTVNFEFYADPDAAHPHNDGRHDLDVMAEGVRIVRGFLDAVPSPGVGPLHELTVFIMVE